MKRIIAFFVVILIFMVSVVFLVSKKGDVVKENSNKILVATSFYPLGEFAKRVGGDLIDVVIVTPSGAEPHDYEPTPQDIIAVRKSKVFVYQGSGFDSWAERLGPDLKKEGIDVINMNSNFNLDSRQGKADPHIWLDPVLASKEVEIIRETLSKIDPTHETNYRSNASKFESELELLSEQYRRELSNCKQNKIIVSHEAFGYLGKRYGFNFISVSGLSPEEEPSAQRIGELTKIVKENDIHYVFFETLVSPKLAETIANETGAQTAVLDPIEGITENDLKIGKNYLSLMGNNLSNLRKALQCNQNQ